MAELAPRRHRKVRFTREMIARMLTTPEDVRVVRMVPSGDPGGMELLLESDRFDEVEEWAETPINLGLVGEMVEVEGKTFWRLEVDL